MDIIEFKYKYGNRTASIAINQAAYLISEYGDVRNREFVELLKELSSDLKEALKSIDLKKS